MINSMTQRDILIIGGGIFGAAIAYHLAQRGLGERVIVLERGQPAGGATSRAAALVTVVRDNPMLSALAQETFRCIATLEERFGEDVGCHRVGALHVAPQAMRPQLEKQAGYFAARGVAAHWLEKNDALARAPWLAPSAFDTACLYPDECYVEPYLLASAYQRVAGQLGVKLQLGAEVQEIVIAADRVSGVTLADGNFLPARMVINAAGAWANLLSVPLDLPLPMAPVRSQYWISENAPIFPRDGAIVLMPEIRAYARPEVGSLLFGVREQRPAVVDPRSLPADLSGFVFDPDDPDGWQNLAEGAETLARYFPSVETLGIAHYLTGPSNYTPDSQLILGAAANISGLFVATGCNGSGITFSGGVGRLISELICGDTPFTDTTVCAPARHGRFDPFSPGFLQSCAAARAKKSSG